MNTSTSHKTPATTTNGLRRSFGPDGCQAVIDGARCGETKNLQIIKEFKRMYEDKMKQIDDIAGGDCIQAKVNLQQEWIKDLTDQNEMLVRVVEELEVEAAERVTLLERKLQQTAKSAGEKLEQVQNDMNNLLELIRRAQKDGKWDTDGLKFYSFDVRDLIKLDQPGALVVPRDNNSKQKDDIVKDKERLIKELEAQLKPYIDSGKSPKDYDSMKKGYKDLEQSMLDMRDALTAEVADKHDTVLCLRREVHLLEEQCRKADQQTHFKDDIIKELRKEIKQLRQQQSTQNQPSSPPRRKSGSPRKRIHHSKTEPDTNVNHLKDGTIVIRDSETIGDSLHTQAIKEKFTDPTNQTIVYICESVPQRQKSKDDKAVLTDTRNCDVSMDVPKSTSHTPNTICTHFSMDHPRDTLANLSHDISLTSIHNMSVMSHSTIEETCVQYSRDILDLLNQTYQTIETKPLPQQDKDVTSFEFSTESTYSVQSPNTTFDQSDICDQKLNVQLDKKVSVEKNSLVEDSLKVKVERSPSNMIATNRKHSQAKVNTDGTIELLYENESLVHRSPAEQNKTLISNASQTINKGIREKDTQTSKTSVMKEPPSYKKKKNVFKSSYRSVKPNPACAVCGKDNATLISLLSRNNQSTKDEADKSPVVNWVDETVCRRNYYASTPYKDEYARGGSKDISFNESEIRAFSSPYPDHTSAAEDVIQIKKIFRGDNVSPTDGKTRKVTCTRQREAPVFTRRLGPNRSVAIPVQPYFMEPNYRQPKPLSNRTLLKGTSRYPEEIALSTKSQSLPSCGPMQHSRMTRMRYVRPPVMANYNHIDTRYLIEQRRNKFAIDLGAEKKIVHGGYVDRWSHFNNTY